jgi:hypothetical protein
MNGFFMELDVTIVICIVAVTPAVLQYKLESYER